MKSFIIFVIFQIISAILLITVPHVSSSPVPQCIGNRNATGNPDVELLQMRQQGQAQRQGQQSGRRTTRGSGGSRNSRNTRGTRSPR